MNTSAVLSKYPSLGTTRAIVKGSLMGGICRSEGRKSKFMAGYTGVPYGYGTEVSGSEMKGNIKSSNTLKYQEHKAIIRHDARFI